MIGFYAAGAMGQGGGPTLWTPALVSTALWLDASDASTLSVDMSDGVSQWDDKSGNGRHVGQSTAGNRPALHASAHNGLDIIRFDGSNDALSFLSAFAQESGQTFIIAGNTTSLGSSWRVFLERTPANVNTAALYIGTVSADYRPSVYWASSQRATWGSAVQRAAITQWALATSGGSATAETRVDGGTAVTASFSASTLADWASVGNASVQQIAMDVYEIVCVVSPSSGLRERIEGYLAWKWNMVSNLPIGHPYKSAPPTV